MPPFDVIDGGRVRPSQSAIRLEQVRLLHGSPLVLLINLVNAAIAAAVLWPVYPRWAVVGWLLLLCALVAARVRLVRKFEAERPGEEEAGAWERSFAIGATATGCLWGLLGSIVLVTDDVAYYVFVAFVNGGMIAGALLRDGASGRAFYGFSMSAALPIIAAFLAKGGMPTLAMGLLLSAFSISVLLVGRDNNRWIVDSIRAKLELADANEELQRTAVELRGEAAERHKALLALEESNVRLKGIGESAQEAIVIADSDGNVVYWNPAAEKMFGYAPDEIIGRSHHLRLAPESMREQAMEGYARFAATGAGPALGKTVTFNALRKDGSEIPIDLSISALRVGDAWHSLGVVRDVSERVKNEERLREAARYSRTLIEASLDPIVTIDAEGVITDVNEAMVRATGASREKLVGSDYFDHLTEPDKARAGFRDVFAKGAITDYPLTIRHASGKLTDALFNASLYRDTKGNVAGVYVSARDITERRRMEMSLRQREAELEEAQRVARVGSWEWLPESNSFKWSKELYRLSGRDPELPPPTLDDFPRFLTPESFARWRAAFERLRVSGESFELDLEVLQPDGSQWLSARGQAERDANGVILRVHGTAQDITTRKATEQNIARLHRELAAKLEAQRRIEQEMKAVARMSDILQACHSRAEAYPVIATTAKNLFHDANGAISIVVEGSHELETVAQWGEDRVMLPAFALDDCWALRTGRRYHVDAPGGGVACRHFQTPPQGSYVCQPLTVHGESTALLHLNLPQGRIDEELQRLIVSFGDVIKLSLSNLKLRETLSEQAMRDQLTKLFNRHYLVETLPREIRRAQRAGVPLTIAMIDIDHFKTLNDTYGHDGGDTVLAEVGALLRTSIRADDIACRYGGEEFILALPECDLKGARTRMEQISAQIKQKTFDCRGRTLPMVTISVGLAQLDDEFASAESLIGAADDALYTAKRKGRDRIELFPAETVPASPRTASRARTATS